MAIELVTGHAGEGHVSSADAGKFNAGVCGAGKYVLNTGQRFAYSIESANLIRIASGDAVNQGRHISIRQNTYEDANILNGTQGKTRIDVITLRYSKVTRQVEGEPVTVEVATVEVIKGTEVSVGTTPEAPAVVSGNIFDGATTDDMPLYHVLITDTSVTSVIPVFSVLLDISNIQQYINTFNTDVAQLQEDVSGHSGSISNLGTRLNQLDSELDRSISELETRVKNTLNDYLIRVATNTGSHTCAPNTGTVNYDYTIPDGVIPEGYKAFDVRCGTTQSYEFYCWSCDFTHDSKSVISVRIQKRSGSGGTIYPWIVITCVKDLS